MSAVASQSLNPDVRLLELEETTLAERAPFERGLFRHVPFVLSDLADAAQQFGQLLVQVGTRCGVAEPVRGDRARGSRHVGHLEPARFSRP